MFRFPQTSTPPLGPVDGVCATIITHSIVKGIVGAVIAPSVASVVEPSNWIPVEPSFMRIGLLYATVPEYVPLTGELPVSTIVVPEVSFMS